MEGTARGSRNRLLAALPPPVMALFAPHLKIVSLKLGAILQREGEPIEHVYFPLDGMISLVVITGDGGGIETVTVGREGAVGVGAGLGRRKAFTRAVVQAPGSAAHMSAYEFQRAAVQSDLVRSLIHESSESMLAQAQQTVACNTTHNLSARLARWLLQTHDRVTGDTLPLTQEFLGQMLGVQRTTVTLAAQQLHQAGAINYRRARIEVVDRSKLEELTCECYKIIRRAGDPEF
jgi:CRP-like cAMP-binding protein